MSTWFGHGRLRLYLLKLLDDGPKHGYEVMRLMEDRTLGMYAPSAGTVYPRLQRLEQDGLVTHTEGEGGRKIYSLTDAGRAELRRRDHEIAELEQELRENIVGIAAEIRGEVRESLRDLTDQLRENARQLKEPSRKARMNWQEWLQDWSSPAPGTTAGTPGKGATPGTPGKGTTPAGAGRDEDVAAGGGPESPAAESPAAESPAAERSAAGPTNGGPAAGSWPVGDFERELARFTEQVRQIAYRAPIDDADVSAAAAVLDEALAKLAVALTNRRRDEP